jgi:hypothetical protein
VDKYPLEVTTFVFTMPLCIEAKFMEDPSSIMVRFRGSRHGYAGDFWKGVGDAKPLVC